MLRRVGWVLTEDSGVSVDNSAEEKFPECDFSVFAFLSANRNCNCRVMEMD